MALITHVTSFQEIRSSNPGREPAILSLSRRLSLLWI